MQTEQELDISMRLSAFFLRHIGLWIANDPADERRMKIIFTYTIWNLIFGMIVLSRDLYFTWFYNGDTLYALANTMSLILTLVKVCVIVVHKKEFMNLVVYMEQHFLAVKYDFHEKEILNNCRKICAFFISSVTTIGICAILSYISTPFIAQIGNNESTRELPFNMWIGILSQSPYYELIFFAQIMSLSYIGICYFCFDNVFCVMAIHLGGQFRILRYRFSELCNIKYQISEQDKMSILTKHVHRTYETFRKYVRQHQALINYYNTLENVYTVIILIQVLVFSVLICLFGYQVLLANTNSARRSIFVFLLIGALSLLFMFTYSCDDVIEHSDNVAIGAYSALWTIMPMNKHGKMLRNDLIMTIERSRRVCCLTANGFFPVSLETYTKVGTIPIRNTVRYGLPRLPNVNLFFLFFLSYDW
ncbi:odorant receptor 63a-like isoform X1 [Bombus affinis]|uniref:odorant receptor 63a-like isoform X1 n=1 Tax=Bombus affinis TaxID=309941 RepID=UPI0021B82963|nr:odorant receptor 63a-like isoform X1 [Bombus affinis]